MPVCWPTAAPSPSARCSAARGWMPPTSTAPATAMTCPPSAMMTVSLFTSSSSLEHELLEEHHGGNRQPHAHDDAPHLLLRDALRIAGAQVLAGQRARRHHARLVPVHNARHREPEGGHHVDERAQQVLERI